MVAARVVRPVGILISSFGEIDRLRSGVNRISEIWNSTPERKVVGTAVPIKGGFVFNHVSLNLGGKEVLKKIDFEIKPGSLVSVVGPAASGKTTLFKVLQGFIQPSSGSVLIDGRSLSSLDLENYRSQVSLVHSNPSFFMGSIEDNLRRARRNISERELNEAITLSGLNKILPDIEGGLSYNLDHASNSLPNSYRQIIGITRALVNNSKVLLFDEVFSSLDKKIQVDLLTNIRKLAKNKTLLLVTHDLRIAKKLDTILVMNDGIIAGHGDHDELLKTVPIYKNLWLLENLSAEEGEVKNAN
jgi:ABC-type multidrug transport system fused ATPase/permease subunit